MNEKDELRDIVKWLNQNYNQNSAENYNIFFGAKQRVVKYNEHTAISLWACGAIVCIYSTLYFIGEDDGYWWINEEPGKEFGRFAYQDIFSIGWTDSFINALTELKKYVWEHGKPIYFSGTNTICHYQLTDD